MVVRYLQVERQPSTDLQGDQKARGGSNVTGKETTVARWEDQARIGVLKK